MNTIKKNLLFAVSILFALSCHSVSASTNLVQNGSFESGTNDWPTQIGPFTIIATNGPSATGTASALLGSGGIGAESEIGQQIATVPGTNYVVQFDYKTLDSNSADGEACVVEVIDNNSAVLLTLLRQSGDDEPTTTFQTAGGTFTAVSGSETVFVTGLDNGVIDNVIVTSGSYSEPGRYTGTVKVSSTVPLQSVGSFHTESVVARINPSGGVYLIKQPSGTIETGAFESENTLGISGTTATVTVKGKTAIEFAVTSNSFTGDNSDIPVINTETFSLKKAGK